ncbi:MAG: hypothetical protein HZA90_09425 [Verrucomicrobia bacterium]|nr:hypothetical protein [Verrucomicrobiota bacterium]
MQTVTPAQERQSVIDRLTAPLRKLVESAEAALQKSQAEADSHREIVARFVEAKDRLAGAQEKHAAFLADLDRFIAGTAEQSAAREGGYRKQCMSFAQWQVGPLARLAQIDAARRNRDALIAGHRAATVGLVEQDLAAMRKEHGPLLKRLGIEVG